MPSDGQFTIGGANDSRRFPSRSIDGPAGVHGYEEFLQVIADPEHEEHESTLRWAGGQFDPEAFDPSAVKFDDPKKRRKRAFQQ